MNGVFQTDVPSMGMQGPVVLTTSQLRVVKLNDYTAEKVRTLSASRAELRTAMNQFQGLLHAN